MPRKTRLADADEVADNPEPRCPLVLLLDTSASMQGERLQALTRGLHTLRTELGNDPLAASRIELAVVTFDTHVRLLQRFVRPDQFVPPSLIASGNTHMAEGIERALTLISARKRFYKRHGLPYYRALIFMITGGKPGSEPEAVVAHAAARLRAHEKAKQVAFFAIGVADADLTALRKIVAREPLRLNELAFQDLFLWLSTSMQTISHSEVDDVMVGLQPIGWGHIEESVRQDHQRIENTTAIARIVTKVTLGPGEPAHGPHVNPPVTPNARPVDENVQFSVYRPATIAPRQWYPLLVFAHLAERRPDSPDEPDPIVEVRRQAEQILGSDAASFRQVTQDSRLAVPFHGWLRIVPAVPGVEFNPPERSFSWIEPVHREEFRVRANEGMNGRIARGAVSVYLDHLLVADIAIALPVTHATPAQQPPACEAGRPYRHIFASYSHLDSAVVERFEHYARGFGDRYMRDVVDLRAGELWDSRLAELIERADVFQLFWSWNSMSSTFVTAEWQHALSLNRPHFVRPVYWQEPFPERAGIPPESLRRIHFARLGAPAGSSIARPSEDLRPEVEFADNPEPRLACVLLLDSSEAIARSLLEDLNAALRTFYTVLSRDPLAARRIELAVITFGGGVKVVRDFTSVGEPDPPILQASGLPLLVDGLETAVALLDTRRTLYKECGISYFRPWIFTVTATPPHGDLAGVTELVSRKEQARHLECFAVAVADFDLTPLRTMLKREPLQMESPDLDKLFSWLAASLRTAVHSEFLDGGVPLPAIDWQKKGGGAPPTTRISRTSGAE